MEQDKHINWKETIMATGKYFFLMKNTRISFVHGSKVKVNVHAGNGSTDRIPAYIRRVIQDPETL